MLSLTSSSSFNSYEKKGKHLYKNNENYKNIANLMEHPVFRVIYDKYFNNWENVKTVLMFMKLYEYIEKTSPIELNGYQKLYLMDKYFKDKKLRENIINQVIKSTEQKQITL